MVGNNETMSNVSKGQYKEIVLQKDGTTGDIVLQDILYIPKLMVNLFSLTKAIEHTGVSLSFRGRILSLTVGTTDKYFDKVFKHGPGGLLGIVIHPTPNHIAATAQTLEINVVHEMFGHPNSQVLATTAAKYGFHTKNYLHVCSNCAISKAKQKNLNKLTAIPSMELKGRIKIDISSVQNTSYGGAIFWLFIQDNFTNFLWSYFIKSMSDLTDTMIDWLKLVQKKIISMSRASA
jgi:hypothetical protein